MASARPQWCTVAFIPDPPRAMDIHDIALSLYAQLLGRAGALPDSDEARTELAREAYRCADAYIRAKDLYIRELPASNTIVDY